MKSLYLLFVVTILLVNGNVIASEQIKKCVKQDKFTLMIHGGAGSGEKPELIQKKMLEVIKTALQKGFNLLKNGEKGENVVASVISILEDSPYFNAGRGGNPNELGFVELDASIMRGSDKNAGAVAAVKLVKNPIKAALRVMNNSRHVMFAGDGADNFAKKEQLDIVNNNYFYTSLKNTTKTYAKFNSINNIGTVGAVVMDRCGDWVAGTSTGGFKTKTSGRIGDSPIIGAGTYAENNICAVSCTGHGEYFIRYAVAHNICSLIKYKNSSGIDASKEVLVNELLPVNGKGGVIVIDNNGQGSFYFTTEGMSRGLVTEKGIYMGGIGWKYDEL
jgi:beta-aspartyl-peptidase (threonine type)